MYFVCCAVVSTTAQWTIYSVMGPVPKFLELRSVPFFFSKVELVPFPFPISKTGTSSVPVPFQFRSRSYEWNFRSKIFHIPGIRSEIFHTPGRHLPKIFHFPCGCTEVFPTPGTTVFTVKNQEPSLT